MAWWRWTVAIAPCVAALGCEVVPLKRDPVEGLEGRYERPTRDVFEVGSAKLTITNDGLAYDEGPFHEAFDFTESTCSTATTCRLSGPICTVAVTKRADGGVDVEADGRCKSMAGTWYTNGGAARAARELTPQRGAATSTATASLSAPTASLSAPTASLSAPTPDDEDGKADQPDDEDDDGSERPAVSRSECLRRCNQSVLACSRTCKLTDRACWSQCNDKAFSCSGACPREGRLNTR